MFCLKFRLRRRGITFGIRRTLPMFGCGHCLSDFRNRVNSTVAGERPIYASLYRCLGEGTAYRTFETGSTQPSWDNVWYTLYFADAWVRALPAAR